MQAGSIQGFRHATARVFERFRMGLVRASGPQGIGFRILV